MSAMEFKLLSTMFSSPLPDGWERKDKLNVELTCYGWGETRLIVHFYFPGDSDLVNCMNSMLRAITRDIKYSQNWGCEFCGDPAREVVYQYFSAHTPDGLWLLTISAHFICDMDFPHVRKGLTRVHAVAHGLGLADAHSPYNTMPLRPAHIVHPLAGSCADCERDATAEKGGAGLKRCSRCRMTRYCSAACQKRDWSRHKIVCRMVHELAFENWHLVKYYATVMDDEMPTDYSEMSYVECCWRWLRDSILKIVVRFMY